VSSSGASLTYPLECGQIKKGGHILIRGFPCKVRPPTHPVDHLSTLLSGGKKKAMKERKKSKKSFFLFFFFFLSFLLSALQSRLCLHLTFKEV
jgi:hypothetical protein